MVVPAASLTGAFRWKRNQNWPYIVVFLVAFLGFLYYVWGPVLMEHAKQGEKVLTQNNIAFVLQLKAGNDPSKSRFVFRLKQCLASICQHSSISLTIHLFANSIGKDESWKLLEEIAPYCVNGYRVKFYDVEEVVEGILAAANVIKFIPYNNYTCLNYAVLRYDRGTRLPGKWSTAGLKAIQVSRPHDKTPQVPDNLPSTVLSGLDNNRPGKESTM